jgi:hypothetical protein
LLNVLLPRCTHPGWKLYAVPAEDPLKKLKDREGSVILESPHNYLDNMDVYEDVHIPGGMHAEYSEQTAVLLEEFVS